MYARILSAEEKRNINQLHKAIEEPEIKLSNKAKQKLFGVFCIASSVAAITLLKTDASLAYAFLMIPMGLILIGTKEKVIW